MTTGCVGIQRGEGRGVLHIMFVPRTHDGQKTPRPKVYVYKMGCMVRMECIQMRILMRAPEWIGSLAEWFVTAVLHIMALEVRSGSDPSSDAGVTPESSLVCGSVGPKRCGYPWLFSRRRSFSGNGIAPVVSQDENAVRYDQGASFPGASRPSGASGSVR